MIKKKLSTLFSKTPKAKYSKKISFFDTFKKKTLPLLTHKSAKYSFLALIILIGTVFYLNKTDQFPFLNKAINVFSQKSAEEKLLPIYSVETAESKIAISFDAAWGADDTDQLLEILRNNDVKATFFVCGYWVDNFPEEIKKMYAEGHEIANHSASHAHPNQLSLEKNKEEIMKAHKKVKDLIGVEMNLYRPPFGEYNNTVLKAAEESGYYCIQWDVDTYETKKQ